MFPLISSNSCLLNLLFVQSHQRGIIIAKRLILGRSNVTRVKIKPKIMRLKSSDRRKDDRTTILKPKFQKLFFHFLHEKCILLSEIRDRFLIILVDANAGDVRAQFDCFGSGILNFLIVFHICSAYQYCFSVLFL